MDMQLTAGQKRDSYAQKRDLSTGNSGEIRARREGKIRGGTVRGTLPAGVLAVHIEARKARGNMGQLRRIAFWQCPASVPHVDENEKGHSEKWPK